jgi:hypothetical protein
MVLCHDLTLLLKLMLCFSIAKSLLVLRKLVLFNLAVLLCRCGLFLGRDTLCQCGKFPMVHEVADIAAWFLADLSIWFCTIGARCSG